MYMYGRHCIFAVKYSVPLLFISEIWNPLYQTFECKQMIVCNLSVAPYVAPGQSWISTTSIMFLSIYRSSYDYSIRTQIWWGFDPLDTPSNRPHKCHCTTYIFYGHIRLLRMVYIVSKYFNMCPSLILSKYCYKSNETSITNNITRRKKTPVDI